MPPVSRSDSIRKMFECVAEGSGYAALIIVSTSEAEARYWQKRLEHTRPLVCGCDCEILSVWEDWISPQGAGNLLGTLYAWRRASQLASTRGIALDDYLAENRSVAMYHTAGKGTRIAPLTAAELNSKSAVKMPRVLKDGGHGVLMTMLEATIFQTAVFARSRGGRLCVWWGDQVFIPERFERKTEHHAEILSVREQVTPELSQYGIIVPCADGAAQREKVPYEKILEMVKPDADGSRRAYKSLGSFNISSSLLKGLLAEFAREIDEKKERLETDHHLWQPLTSTLEEYVESGKSADLWHRMDDFRRGFLADHPGHGGILDFLDIGEAWWWDYGRLTLYFKYLRKALEKTEEGEACRQFFDLPAPGAQGIVIDSRCERAALGDCLVLSSALRDVSINDSVIIESDLNGTKADSTLLYRALEPRGLRLEAGTVIAGVPLPGRTPCMIRTSLLRDGREDWDERLAWNEYSYADLYEMLRGAEREGIKSSGASCSRLRKGQ
jgi:hypothetical protein